MKITNVASFIDHTILKPTATKDDIIKLCNEAQTYNFASVCVNPTYVADAYEILKNTNVAVCTVVGFPLGANKTSVKVFEAETAVNEGATEIDMVINIGALKSGNIKLVEDDVTQVSKAVKKANKNAIVKVIIETCFLTEDEKNAVCQMLLKTGVEFVKTSTGFGTGGATVSDIALMKKNVEDKMQIKASGGIKTYDDFTQMVNMGANRIGTSSGIEICKQSLI